MEHTIVNLIFKLFEWQENIFLNRSNNYPNKGGGCNNTCMNLNYAKMWIMYNPITII